METSSYQDLLKELLQLRSQHSEEKEIIHAIRNGKIDALVVSGSHGPQIFTLRGSEHPYRAFVEQMTEAAVTLSPGGLILYSNMRLAEMLELPLEHIIGSRMSDWVLPADQEVFNALLREGASGRNQSELHLVGKNKKIVSVYISINTLALDEMQVLCMVITDLTNQKKSEELVSSEKLARSILEQATEAIVVCQPDGQVIRASQTAQNLNGQQILFRQFDDLFPLEVEADHEYSHLFPDEKFGFGRMWKLITAGSTPIRDVETIFKRNDGKLFHLLVSAAPLKGSQQDILGLIITFKDITERQKYEEELRQAKEDLHEYAQTLEARIAERTATLKETNAEMEAFTYSVSHDLRAPLRAMQGFAQILAEDYATQLGDTGQDFAKRIVTAASRMDILIQDLLAYSRVSREELQIIPVSLDAMIEDALDHFQNVIQERKATIHVNHPLNVVLAHYSSLFQAVSNLLGNALKFVPPDRDPVVKIYSRQYDGTVRLWIEDNGIGIDEKHYDRIFRVFERLHGMRSYAGTGIGLAIVRKTIERMGGKVGVISTVGIGSQFWMDIPCPPPTTAEQGS